MSTAFRSVLLLSLWVVVLTGCVAPSPPSGRIAFSSRRDGNGEIYVINADGSGLERLTRNDTRDGCPAWSPDGQLLAFTSDRDGNNEVYVMRADGSDQRRLTDTPGSEFHPDWSPDGRLIAFRAERDSNKVMLPHVEDLVRSASQG